MTKNRFAKISLVVIAILAFCMVLSACNFFDGVTKVTDVDISVDSGLVDSNGDGVYEVGAGKEFSLSVNWHNILINNPTIRWFVSSNGGEKQQIENASNQKITQKVVGAVGARYSISASVNSVDAKAAIEIVIVESSSGDSTPEKLEFSVGVSGISDTDSNSYAEAKYGKAFSVVADISGIIIADPEFEWFVSEDGTERKLDGNSSSISFTISSRTIEKYEFRAVLKGEVDSPSKNSAKVEFVDSEIENPSISSTSHTIAQGKIQQNIADAKEDVVLVAGWNSDELPDDLVTFAWYVDDTLQAGEVGKTFTYDVDGISSACEKVVKLKVSYKTKSVEAAITLAFVEEFLPVGKVELSVTQDSEVSKAYDLPTTFKVANATTTTPGTATVSAIAYPDGTDLLADCVWTVRDMSGTRTLSEKSRTVSIPLAYGKNVITATVQNMESRSVIVYALTAADLSAHSSVIQDTFVWDGTTQDHYINNQEELNIFIGYLVSTHETSADAAGAGVQEVYLAPSEWRDGVNTTTQFATDFHTALEQGVDESGTPNVAHQGNAKFWLSTASSLGVPTEAYSPATAIEQRNVYVRYSALDSSKRRTKLPVDDFEESMLVKNSNQLMRALTWGYKPTFETNASGTKLQALYNKAREVLLTYVGKSMTDVEKLQVIYDWLANEVVYDYATAEYTGSDGIKFNAYYLEGVFDDHQAVCDGKSKAFALLCGMEGIRAMRIIGTANGGGHAWNKVLVDVDGDGAREWFFVDSTWGDNKLSIGDDSKETLTYQYFLTTDAAMSSTHASSMAQPVCDTDYNCYEDSYVKVSGTKSVCQYITELQQLKDIRDYSSAHGNVMVQVKVASSVESQIPLVMGMGRVGLGDGVYYVYAS